MGLMDLFKGVLPVPANNGGDTVDSGFGLPHLFNQETRARLGVLGSNLIAAGAGNSPDAGAILQMHRDEDKREEDRRLKAAAKRYADKIRAKNPELAEAIDADYTLISTIMGKNVDLENQKSLERHKRSLNPITRMIDEAMGGDVGTLPSMGGGAAASDPAAPPSPSPAPGVSEATPIMKATPAGVPLGQGGVQNSLYQPAQAVPEPEPPGPKIDPKMRRLMDIARKFYPEMNLTDEEAMRWVMAAGEGGENASTAMQQIVNDRQQNAAAQAAIEAARLKREQEIQDQNRATATAAKVAEDTRAAEAAVKAKPLEDFNKSLPQGGALSHPGQTNPDGTPYRGLDKRRHEQIAKKYGLTGKAATLANTGAIEAAAAAGPDNLASTVRAVTEDNIERTSTIPQDYEMLPDGTMGLIKGSPTWKAEQIADKKRGNVSKIKQLREEVILEDLTDAIKMTEAADWTDPATGFGAETLAQAVGGSTAADVEQLLASVRANIGFDRLTEMRADPDNKTGGALGQVAVQELLYLQSVMGSLSQKSSKPMLLKRMKRLKKIYESMSPKAKHFLLTGETDGPDGDEGPPPDLNSKFGLEPL